MVNKSKKIPERMCVSCREMKEKNQLLRLVNTGEQIVVDLTGKLSGRGVYICRCKACVQKAYKNKGFSKVNGFSITEELLDQLEKIIEQ